MIAIPVTGSSINRPHPPYIVHMHNMLFGPLRLFTPSPEHHLPTIVISLICLQIVATSFTFYVVTTATNPTSQTALIHTHTSDGPKYPVQRPPLIGCIKTRILSYLNDPETCRTCKRHTQIPNQNSYITIVINFINLYSFVCTSIFALYP